MQLPLAIVSRIDSAHKQMSEAWMTTHNLGGLGNEEGEGRDREKSSEE